MARSRGANHASKAGGASIGASTLVELLSWRADTSGNRRAAAFVDADEKLGDSISYAQLDRRARAIGALIASRGERGQRVLLCMPTGPGYVAAFFGCCYGGAIAVPLFPPRKKSFKAARLGNVLCDSAANLVVTTASELPGVRDWLSALGSSANAFALEDVEESSAEAWVDPNLRGEDIAFLQYTSGSTNVPKGVMVTHANLFHNMSLMCRRWSLDAESTIVSWLPIFHDLGIVGNNLLSVYLGASQYLMVPQNFVKRPGAWLRAISKYRAQVAMAPNFAYRLCTQRTTPTERAALDLSSWRVAISCGEPVVPEIVDAFCATFESVGFCREAMIPALGMAETTLFVSGGTPQKTAHAQPFDAVALRSLQARPVDADAAVASRTVMSCGAPMDDFTLRIVDPQTSATLSEGQLGEIWVAGPSVTQGYWRKPDITETQFRANTADSKEGAFLRTGDLGFIYESELYVSGRLKNVIIINGQNFVPTDIEIALEESLPQLRPDFGVAFAVESGNEERLVVVYETEATSAEATDIQRAFRAAAGIISELFDLQLCGLVLVARGTLSKTTSGKVTRGKTREAFLNNELQTVSRWLHPSIRNAFFDGQQQDSPSGIVAVDEREVSRRRIEEWLYSEVARHSGLPLTEIEPLAPFSSFGLDSTAMIEVVAGLEQLLGASVASNAIYDYPNIRSLALHLAAVPAGEFRIADGKGRDSDQRVAIVGLACRFPGAPDIATFWQNLVSGIDAIDQLDAPPAVTANADSNSMTSQRCGGLLKDIDCFDFEFFGISALEAAAMDPQQRLLIEVAWEALESAGLTLEDVGGSATGVFVGIGSNDYGRLSYANDAGPDRYDGTGNSYSIAANRLSYLWDLRGPSMAIDTACSSSLVAVHTACRSLVGRECELAITGGVNLIFAPEITAAFTQAGMMSSRGRCRSFDDDADGYVRSEGCGVVVLKPFSAALRDGDTIHAVISGSAVNQDGRSNGLTAPNGPAQERAVRAAMQRANVPSDAIDYIETHGSGTPLGDPIEAGALARVFGKRDQPLPIGSVKTNIGHLEAAAGIAGLLKVVLSLANERLPASLHFERPNHRIPWAQIPLEVCADTRPWPRVERPRRAGVASFGFGGTNAHAILEEAPLIENPPPVEREAHLLTLSAKSPEALTALAQRFDALLAETDSGELHQICTAAAKGRTHFRHRLAVVGESSTELRERLPEQIARTAVQARSPVVWLFSGQGSASAGMAGSLYRSYPVFRERIDACLAWAERAGLPQLKKTLLEDDDGPIHSAQIAQPSLFAFQWSLAGLWLAAGVKPDVVLGHSIGEYAAACCAGLIAMEDALGLLAERGRLMNGLEEPGGMIAVAAAADDLAPLLEASPGISIAAYNGPEQTVCAGANTALDEFETLASGLRCTRLSVTHAFHSPLMRPVIAPFAATAANAALTPAVVPFVSSVTCEHIEPGVPLDSDYWTRHIEAPVKFERALRAVQANGIGQVLEIGPRPALVAIAQEALGEKAIQWLQEPGESRLPLTAFLIALGRLYSSGAQINWAAIEPTPLSGANRLPTYPFQRKRCWNRNTGTTVTMNETTTTAHRQESQAATVNSTNVDRGVVMRHLAGTVANSLGLAPDAVDPAGAFLEMGMDSISLIGVIREIERKFALRIGIRDIFETLYNLELLSDHIADKIASGDAAVAESGQSASTTVVQTTQSDALTAREPISPAIPINAPAAQDFSAGPEATGTASWHALMRQQMETMAQLMQNQLTALGAAPSSHSLKSPTPTAPRPPANIGEPSIPNWKVAETSAAKLTPQQQQHLDELITRYCARTRRSKEYAQRHRHHLADNRVVAGFRMLTKEMHYPLVGKAAKGSRIWDIDGNEYIDATMGFGVNLFGHNPPFIADAIATQLKKGMQLGPQSALAGEVAGLICELTGNDRAAFVSTGTEAIMIACRLARAVTGRDRIVIFNGAYHGQYDATIAVTDPQDLSFQAQPGVPGIAAYAVANTVMLNYDDPASLKYIAAHAGELAAVMVEPVQSRQPDLQPREFLRELRAITKKHGIALIFDEMITGFRCHPGGAQALFDVRADLVTYGKIIGGGLPIGVVSGADRFMDVIDGGRWQYGDDSYPAVETTFVSGTHSKHPLTMAASLAVLRHLKDQGPGLQQRLNERTAAFAGDLNAYFSEQGLPIRVPYFSSIFRIAFAGNANLMYYHLLEKGVFLWEGRVYALSTAHSESDLARVIDAIKISVEELRDGGFLQPSKSPANKARAKAVAPVAPEPSLAGSTDTPITPSAPAKEMKVDFSLSFFGRYEREYHREKYNPLYAAARFGDQRGFTALWFPERHFHPFGGFSPNPSVTAAALARETTRIHLRGGSVVFPLHHPIRIAEEWALVDNLSQGRVGIAAASGWHPNDFVLAPENYNDNREITFRNINVVQQLWRGESVASIGGTGKPFDAKIYPLPKQASLPMWLTVVKNPDTYAEAGRLGLGILTNMMGQTVAELRENITLYRHARAEAGFNPEEGIVTVLVHTYVTEDAETAQKTAAQPFCTYLETMSGLLDSLAKNFGHEENFNKLDKEDRDYLLNATYRKYLETSALIGSPDSCQPIVESLIDAGVNELACFVDFGIAPDLVFEALPNLDRLKSRFAGNASEAMVESADRQTQEKDTQNSNAVVLEEAL